jgi:Fur family peroxide stress response transcriptional regulator
MAILQSVLACCDHPTAEDVYERVSRDFPMMSLATVYKTLHVLEELDEVVQLEVGGRGHYDGDVRPHPHLICVRCGVIIDLPPEAMARLPQEAMQGTGFRPLWYSLEIHGLCAQCADSP